MNDFKPSSPSPTIHCCFNSFIFTTERAFETGEGIWLSCLLPALQNHRALSVFPPPPMLGNDITSAPGRWPANKNNCYWPRALLQGIFLEPCSAFLQVPCFLVQTYHGLKIPCIFYAVFPLGLHNGAVLLLSSASVLEREGGQIKGWSTK